MQEPYPATYCCLPDFPKSITIFEGDVGGYIAWYPHKPHPDSNMYASGGIYSEDARNLAHTLRDVCAGSLRNWTNRQRYGLLDLTQLVWGPKISFSSRFNNLNFSSPIPPKIIELIENAVTQKLEKAGVQLSVRGVYVELNIELKTLCFSPQKLGVLPYLQAFAELNYEISNIRMYYSDNTTQNLGDLPQELRGTYTGVVKDTHNTLRMKGLALL